jgi:autotransporter-associated beta strand protein
MRASLIYACLLIALVFNVEAADITWVGGMGSWNTIAQNWEGGTAAWDNTAYADDIAVFDSGTGGNINVTEPINLAGLRVTVNGYIVKGEVLNFGAAQGSIDTSALGTTGGNAFNLDSNLAGSGGLTIASHGNTDVSGGGSSAQFNMGGDNNGLTGGIAVTQGLVQFDTQDAAGSNTITFSDGAGLLVTGTRTQFLYNDMVFDSGTAILRPWGSATIGITGDISGSGGFEHTDGGWVILTGDNSFTGPALLSRGTTAVTSINSVSGGSATSALGAPTTAADGRILMSDGAQARLYYFGAGESSDREIRFVSGNGGIVTAEGSGTLTLTSDMTGANAAMGVVFNGGGSGEMEGISDTGALLNFSKQGAGKWVVNGDLTLRGGNIRPQGGILDFAGFAGTTDDAIISGRSNGGVLRIADGTSVKTTTANSNGIIAGWATYGGDTWAVANGSGNAITGLSTFTDDTWASGNNTTVTWAGADPAADSSTYTLRFNDNDALTLTLSGSNIIEGGGLLVTPNVGANDTTITGGTLMGADSADLLLHQNNADGDLIIESVIANNNGATGLTKTGSGTVVLTAANSYTGTTRVYEGTLEAQSRSGDAAYEVSQQGTLRIGYTTGGGYANTNLKIYGAGTAATTGVYLEGGTSYNGQGRIELYGAPTTIRQYGSGLAAIGMFDINGNAITVAREASGSVIDPNIEMVSRGYGMSVDVAEGLQTETGDLVIAGRLNVGSLGFYKRGAGSVRVDSAATAGNNAVKIQGGTFIAGNDNVIGENAVLQISGGAGLRMNGYSQQSSTLSGAGWIVNDSPTAATLTVNQAGDAEFSGTIGGDTAAENNLALVKTGDSILTLSGANTYTGNTTVQAGTLVLNGSLASAVTAETGTLVSGTGAFNGGLTMNAGSTLSPGSSPGTLSIGGDLTLDGSGLAIDIWSDDGAGTGHDLVSFSSGSLTLANAPTISVDLNSVFDPALNKSYTIISGISDWTGTWGDVSVLNAPQSWTDAGKSFRIDQGSVMLTVIPEPATFALFALAALLHMLRRRQVG